MIAKVASNVDYYQQLPYKQSKNVASNFEFKVNERILLRSAK